MTKQSTLLPLLALGHFCTSYFVLLLLKNNGKRSSNDEILALQEWEAVYGLDGKRGHDKHTRHCLYILRFCQVKNLTGILSLPDRYS